MTDKITREARAAAIIADFQAFIEKWGIEVDVATHIDYGGEHPAGIEFSWDGKYSDAGETEVEYGTVNVGNWCHHKNKTDYRVKGW